MNPIMFASDDVMRARVVESIITSRLLILQSKRLMLNALERHADHTGNRAMRSRVERLRVETDNAQYKYRSAVLAWSSPEHNDYWLIAYSRMIAMGHTIVGRMRDAAVILPLADRYQISAEVEMMEHVVGSWTDSMRAKMATEVA